MELCSNVGFLRKGNVYDITFTRNDGVAFNRSYYYNGSECWVVVTTYSNNLAFVKKDL